MVTTEPTARERILDAATHRYYAEGIRTASADRLLADAGVSKATFYRHFPTKNDLVAAYLQRVAATERARFTAEVHAHPDDPAAVLRWYARGVGEASCSPGFRGCPFINAAAELADDDHPARLVVEEHRSWLIDQAAALLTAMGVSAPSARAEQLMMLRDGAMVAGYVGRTPDAVASSLHDAGRAILGC